MESQLQIVTHLPLRELWDDDGLLPAERGDDLATDEVGDRLRRGCTTGIVANVGDPLRWLHGAAFFDWWKAEAKPRLLRPADARWHLESLPDERGWLASDWTLGSGAMVVVFEAFH